MSGVTDCAILMIMSDKPKKRGPYKIKSPSRGGYREGGGRPPTVEGGYTEYCYARLTTAQKRWLLEIYGGCTLGIRALIEADMERGGEKSHHRIGE